MKTHRITAADAWAKTQNLQKVTAALRQTEPGGAGDWRHTERARPVFEIEPTIRDLGISYATEISADFATLDWRGALKELERISLKTTAIQAAAHDSAILLEKINAEPPEMTVEAALASCDARVEKVTQEFQAQAGI